MLAAVRPFASPGNARITLPGAEGGFGRAVDGLEGFARTFLLAGFRIAGERGEGLDELIEFYARGLAAGADPSSPERWVRLPEQGQAKVEAASIALVLDLTRPWIWDRLDDTVREQIVEYLAPAVGDETYPRVNWVWFRLVVQTFLRSVGGPYSLAEMADDLAAHDLFGRADGWISDGMKRAYDHYVGWALHLYPTMWARMSGAEELAQPRRERDAAMLDRFLTDAVRLVGADGSPLIQGRSLTYRFAAAAPFWAGAIASVPSVPPGQLRRAARLMVEHFGRHGAPDDDGLLSLGWHAPWRRLAQSYSGPGSPYWAAKGLLGLALPADHPVWTCPEVPIPAETGPVLRSVRAPGWIVTSTPEDGIVRVLNHGTDHTFEGTFGADSPLYARLGYSTATSPVLDDQGWDAPLDQAVVLVDADGRTTHRSGMRLLEVRVDDGWEVGSPGASPGVGSAGAGGSGVGVAGSVADVHWVEVDQLGFDYGEGRSGRLTPAGRLTVYSIVRGAWELRLSRVDALAAGVRADDVRLRVGGWAVAGPSRAAIHPTGASVVGDTVRSRLLVPDGPASGAVAAISEHDDASPLGPGMRVPYLEFPVRIGCFVAALVELSAGGLPWSAEASVSLTMVGPGRLQIRAAWPDGVKTSTQIDEYGAGPSPTP
jgi:hypothetical protein